MSSSPVSDEELRTRTFLEGGRIDSEPLSGLLMTDAKVLARVTDGIYRQPASALRELISNSWDADATEVHIQTDRPRFGEIIVRDNGIGMDSATLAHVLHHIGGSAKRSDRGTELGLTAAGENRISPGGRMLIGKIGIGLFAVSQITRSFQIVTKRAGETYWNVARVVMNKHSDSAKNTEDQYEAGRFEVWNEFAEDASHHGTTIFLDAIWPQTRETLQDREVWRRYEAAQAHHGGQSVPDLPYFHIGAVQDQDVNILIDREQNIPWQESNSPDKKMLQFLRALEDRFYSGGVSNPSVEKECDYYLQAMWQLATWCPLPYIDGHPVGDVDHLTSIYELSENDAKPIRSDAEVVRTFFQKSSGNDFRVVLDGVELKRPIPVRNLPTTDEAIGHSLLFVGAGSAEFGGLEETASGGPIKFRAYFRWSPKVIPTENRGIIIRIGGASGMGYDPSFLGFPVSEQRRLSQITCELFVEQGLDEALNIDRESFNFSHPHVVFLTRWVHRALRLVIARQKRVGAEARKEKASHASSSASAALHQKLEEIAQDIGREDDLASVGVSEEKSDVDFTAEYFVQQSNLLERIGLERGTDRDWAIERAVALVQLLDIYDLISELSVDDLTRLIADIQRVMTPTGRNHA